MHRRRRITNQILDGIVAQTKSHKKEQDAMAEDYGLLNKKPAKKSMNRLSSRTNRENA